MKTAVDMAEANPSAERAVAVGDRLLTVEGLVKAYKKRRVVDGVSVHVNAGEIVGLLGPNGAGKTTSFNMVVGLVKPDEGTVQFCGEDITGLAPHRIARKGLVVRLDAGPGGVGRGHAWILHELDTLRVAAFWTGDAFIDWAGINFDGRHGRHPRVAGDVQATLPTMPGWAHPGTGSFADPRPLGRDGEPYGPLPRDHVRFRAVHHVAVGSRLHAGGVGVACRRLRNIVHWLRPVSRWRYAQRDRTWSVSVMMI
jgi:hypothetical protein